MNGWTNPAGHSIYNFIIMTYDHQEFLYQLQDLSIVKYTAQLLAEEIEKVLTKIGPNKFTAVVTDNASNCAAARNIICEKYPFIFNNRCIAHCINLITKNILNISI
jgi:hypothetical protein